MNIRLPFWRQVKFPGDLSHFLFKLPETGNLKAVDTQQDATGGAQMQVGLIAVQQSPAKFNTTVNNRCIFNWKPEGRQLPETKIFEAGRSGNKIGAPAADDMPFDTFGKGVFNGHCTLCTMRFAPCPKPYTTNFQQPARGHKK